MTFSAVGNGEDSNKSSAPSWTSVGTIPGSFGAVGDLYVVAIATDNWSTGDGNLLDISGVHDDVPRNWTEAVQFTNGQGSAGAGATIGIYYWVATTPVVGTEHFIFDFATNLTAKSYRVERFTRDTSATLTVDQTTATANDASDAGQLTITPGAGNREYLFFRATAHETNATTWSTTTTPFVFAGSAAASGTSGGSAVTNMMVSVEYLVRTTGSSVQSDPSCTAVDHASAMVSFYDLAAAAKGIPFKRKDSLYVPDRDNDLWSVSGWK